MQDYLTVNEASELRVYDRRHIWHPFTPLGQKEDPLLISSGEGVYLKTADGRSVIDAISSWWVNLHGHSHPVIAKAVADQAAKLEHVIFAGFTHQPAIDLARNLVEILPLDNPRIFFSDNGSTSVEVAIKMAIQYLHISGIKRHKVLAIKGAYHGDTFGAMSVGERGLFTRPFFPYLFDVEFVDMPTEKNFEQIYRQVVSLVDSGDVGCFIYEPLVQAAGGMRMYSAGMLDKLVGYAQRNGVVCIADEVFTGFGRTGKLFASDYVENKPDLIALSKGLTGGTLPLGVTACSSRILEAFDSDDFGRTFFHGHSFTANPVACAAANASYGLLRESSCQDAIARISDNHREFLQRLQGYRKVREVRSLGTILALEVEDGATAYDNALAKKIYSFFLDRDILLRPLGNVIYVLPPYVIKDDECQHIYSAILAFLDQLD